MIRGPEFVSGGWPEGSYPLRNSRALIIGSNSAVRATGVEDSRRFLRELDEAPGGNNLYYILQCLRVPASVTRVWTRKVHWVATECSRNDGSKTQYYIVILDQLQGRSGALEQASESWIRGPLTHAVYHLTKDKNIILMAIYVDNSTITRSSPSLINDIQKEIEHIFKIILLRPISWLLEIEVTCDRESHILTLSQKIYIDSLLQKFNIEKYKPASTSLDPSI